MNEDTLSIEPTEVDWPPKREVPKLPTVLNRKIQGIQKSGADAVDTVFGGTPERAFAGGLGCFVLAAGVIFTAANFAFHHAGIDKFPGHDAPVTTQASGLNSDSGIDPLIHASGWQTAETSP